MIVLDESSGLDSVLDTTLAALTPAEPPAAADEAPAGTAAGGLIEAIVTPEQARVFINVLATTRFECYF